MTIQEIRNLTGLSQGAFSSYYNIPVSTIKKWESDPDSPNHRQCPVYVKRLLERAVQADFQNYPVRVHKTTTNSEQQAEYVDPLYQVGPDWILCGSSALEYMGYFVGHINGPLYAYSLDTGVTPPEGYICVANPPTIEFAVKDGIKYTTINQTVNDMLSNDLLEDPQAIMETLEELSYNPPEEPLKIRPENMDKYRYYQNLMSD